MGRVLHRAGEFEAFEGGPREFYERSVLKVLPSAKGPAAPVPTKRRQAHDVQLFPRVATPGPQRVSPWLTLPSLTEVPFVQACIVGILLSVVPPVGAAVVWAIPGYERAAKIALTAFAGLVLLVLAAVVLVLVAT